MRDTAEATTVASRVEISVALRMAGPDDAWTVAELAELDEARPLQGEVLLALISGRAVAALALADGRVVADPFAPTAEAVALLRLRAAQLEAARGGRRRRWVLRPRLAGSPSVVRD